MSFVIIPPGGVTGYGNVSIDTGGTVTVGGGTISSTPEEFSIADAPIKDPIFISANDLAIQNLRRDSRGDFFTFDRQRRWSGWFNEVRQAQIRPQLGINVSNFVVPANDGLDIILQFPPGSVQVGDFPVASLPLLPKDVSYSLFVDPDADKVILRLVNATAANVTLNLTGKITIIKASKLS